MERTMLANLIKKDLLLRVWKQIDRTVNNNLDINQSKFSEELTGSHSWYSDANNRGEDIRLSSLLRIFGMIKKLVGEKESIDYPVSIDAILTEGNLIRIEMLNYLLSSKEDYITDFISEKKEIFLEIRKSLSPYSEGLLKRNKLNEGYNDLKKILDKLERRKDEK